MSYTYEKLEKNQIKVKIVISKADWENATEQSYEKNKVKFNIQGFRKGKAPRKVIEKNYGDGVFFDDALDIAFSKEYLNFLQNEKEVNPIDNPDIEIEKFDENGLVINAKVNVVPEVELGEYTGLTIEKSKAKVKKEDVDAEIERTRQRGARYVAVERSAVLGDTLDIDFEGSVDGVKFDGGKANNYRLELGSHSFIDTFEDQLVGVMKGEEKTITVKFPKDYPAENLADKNADFAVKVNAIEEKQLPELNDEFASNVSEFETLEEMRNDIKARQEKTMQERIDREAENGLIEKIVKASKCDVPEVIVERQLDAIMHDFEMRLSYQGIKLDDYVKYSNTTIEDIRASRKEQAEVSAKTRLCLEEIIKKENLFVTLGELNEKLTEIASKYKKTLEDYKKQLGDRQIAYIENEILMDKVLKFLKENNNII